MSSCSTCSTSSSPTTMRLACASLHQGVPRRVAVQTQHSCRSRAAKREPDTDCSRRSLLQTAILTGICLQQPRSAAAVGFKKELKRRKIPVEEYSTTEDGLQFYDLVPGNGPEVQKGTKVSVHFDCMYKGIDVVSSRSARLLGGNRSIAEPFQFTAGIPVTGQGAKKINDSANGLFAGTGGPRPPPALGTAVVGMRVGGKRSVIIPADRGYGAQGLQEIPPNSPFELQVEVLSSE